MALYFFDVDDGSHATKDNIGTECVDVRDARHKALQALPDIIRDALPGDDMHDVLVTVRDGPTPIYTFTLSLSERWLIAPPT